MGFHVGLHFNCNAVTRDFPDLVERFKPDGVAQQIELGDKWYDIGKKGRKGQPTQIGPMSRAQHWYQLAEPKITGISNPRIGLLSIGEEPGKGDTLRKETYELPKLKGLTVDQAQDKILDTQMAYGKTIEETIAASPDALAPLRLHYLRWVLFDVGPNLGAINRAALIASVPGDEESVAAAVARHPRSA